MNILERFLPIGDRLTTSDDRWELNQPVIRPSTAINSRKSNLDQVTVKKRSSPFLAIQVEIHNFAQVDIGQSYGRMAEL